MSRLITLPFEEGRITLQPDACDWSQATVVTPQSQWPLGAGNLGAIARRVKEQLAQNNPIGEIDDVSVLHLLSFSELHGSIYLEASAEPVRSLFFQDRDANLFHVARVSAEQLSQWQETLAASSSTPCS